MTGVFIPNFSKILTVENFIPLTGLKRQYALLREEILDATDKVLQSGIVMDGENTGVFETILANYCHRKFAVTVNSGTNALLISYLSLISRYNISKDSNSVAIPSFSFAATLNSVILSGNKPKFIDINNTGVIDVTNILPNSVEIVTATNMFGNMVDFDRLRQIDVMFHGDSLIVVEDAAQSFGSTYNGVPSGSFGHVSILSFDPMKNFPNYGNGGAILTDDHELFKIVSDMKNNGKGRHHLLPGTNSRMSEIDCAQMLVKFQYFEQWQKRRQQIADYYNKNLDERVIRPPLTPGVVSCWHKYVIKIPHSINDFRKELISLGVDSKITYPQPLHLMDVNSSLALGHDLFNLENTVNFSRHCISIPIYPELTDAEVEYIVSSVNKASENILLSV